MGRHRLSQFFAVAALTLAANAGAKTPSSDPDDGKCLVLTWVRFTGQIQAAQIIKSSGASRLDEACIKGVLNQSMKPGSQDGILVDAWVTVPIVWKLQDSKGHSIPPAVHDSAVRPIPMLARDQALNLDPPYDPRSATDQRLEAICGVHAQISADGVVESLRIEHSSGSAALDHASMDALYAANFTAAQEDGKPVAAESDIWLAWGPPRPPPAKGK
jgi:TonB family protein